MCVYLFQAKSVKFAIVEKIDGLFCFVVGLVWCVRRHKTVPEEKRRKTLLPVTEGVENINNKEKSTTNFKKLRDLLTIHKFHTKIK